MRKSERACLIPRTDGISLKSQSERTRGRRAARGAGCINSRQARETECESRRSRPASFLTGLCV